MNWRKNSRLTYPSLIAAIGLAFLFADWADAKPSDVLKQRPESKQNESVKVKVKAGPKPVVYEFYTTWCKPCKTFAPIFESVLDRHKDKIDKSVLDSEDQANASLVKKFGIHVWPTLVFVNPGGRVVYRYQGVLTEAELEKHLNDLLTQ